jgi:predicted Ser/Thr protein kinase
MSFHLNEIVSEKFRVDAELGRGGMGVVFRATQLNLDRTVALKALSAQGAQLDDWARAAFAREANAIAKLVHPNIIRIFDSGVHRGYEWMALEYVEGGDLQDMLAARSAEGRWLSGEEAMRLLQQIASGLDHAHDFGLIHRDLKPKNVLLGSQGEARIADFGIVHVMQKTGRIPSDGDPGANQIVGTPQFMSPEQLMGHSVSRASDVYALGVVAFLLLAGRLPFDGPTPLAIARMHFDSPVPIAWLEGYPTAVHSVVSRALDKQAERRFGSASLFVEELRRAMAIPWHMRLNHKALIALGSAFSVFGVLLTAASLDGGAAPPSIAQSAEARESEVLVGRFVSDPPGVQAVLELSHPHALGVEVSTVSLTKGSIVGVEVVDERAGLMLFRSDRVIDGAQGTGVVFHRSLMDEPPGRYTVRVTVDGRPLGKAQDIVVRDPATR